MIWVWKAKTSSGGSQVVHYDQTVNNSLESAPLTIHLWKWLVFFIVAVLQNRASLEFQLEKVEFFQFTRDLAVAPRSKMNFCAKIPKNSVLSSLYYQKCLWTRHTCFFAYLQTHATVSRSLCGALCWISWWRWITTLDVVANGICELNKQP